MQRPTGVTILAVLNFIAAAFCALFALGAGAIGAIVGASAAAGAQSRSPLAMIAGLGGAMAAVVFLLCAALSIVVGIGLLKLLNWARILTIVLAAIGLVFGLLGIVSGLAHLIIPALITQLIAVAICAWIVLYLLKPHVKQAFAGGQSATSATA